jgi:hypothetical protein
VALTLSVAKDEAEVQGLELPLSVTLALEEPEPLASADKMLLRLALPDAGSIPITLVIK